MDIKWKIYIITFFSYSVVHSVRTMWSAAKSNLTFPPFNYQVKLLGTIDMIILFTLAISMNVFGRKIQIWGPKKCLLCSLVGLALLNTLIGILLVQKITYEWLYIIFFGMGIGMVSSLAWPSCLYMVGLYFSKNSGIKLSIWNGSSQFGDFISLITYFIIAKNNQTQPQVSFFIISLFLFMMGITGFYFIPDDQNQQNKKQQAKVQQHKVQQAKQTVIGQNMQYNNLQDQKQIKSDNSQTQTVKNIKSNSTINNNISELPSINFLKIWTLPGVAFNVLSFGLIKSVNSFMVGWMVYYLLELNLGSQAFVITISWSCSVFIGGIVCSIINKSFNKLIFIGQLSICMICFILLQQFYLGIQQGQIIFSIVLCGFFYGGPYSLMGTAIPLELGNKPQVLKYSNGKSAIISLSQGFGQLCCGISLIIIPSIGIRYLHIAGAVYCSLAAMLLLGDFYMEVKQKIQIKKKQKLAKQLQNKSKLHKQQNVLQIKQIQQIKT